MTVKLSLEERRKVSEENSWSPARPQEEPSEAEHRVYPEGRGIYLRDSDGKDYIDATSGNWCTILGHGNKRVIQATVEQFEEAQYPPPGHCDVSLRLLQRIAEVTPGDLNRVSLYLHGSDANEAALATARGYFKVQGKHNSMIISRFHAYHGQTLGAVALTTLGRRRTGMVDGLDLASAMRSVYPMFAPYCYRCGYGLDLPGRFCFYRLRSGKQNKHQYHYSSQKKHQFCFHGNLPENRFNWPREELEEPATSWLKCEAPATIAIFSECQSAGLAARLPMGHCGPAASSHGAAVTTRPSPDPLLARVRE